MVNKYSLEPAARALLADLGLSVTAVLRRAGLRLDLLARGSVKLHQDEFFSLWRAIEAEANHPNLPLLLGEALSPELFSPPLFAAMLSPDLNVAAQRIAQYKKLIGPLRLDLDIDDTATTVSFSWPPGAEPPATMVLTELLFWVEMVRFGTRTRVVPTRAAVPTLPADMAAYAAVLGIELEQANTPSVTFAAADAARPFLAANEAIWATFEPELRRRLVDLDVDARTSDRVHAVLLDGLPVGRATVSAVARELAISPRTLHRQLKAEDSSFQGILNSTREQLARHYLNDPALSATEIGFLLGYADTSSFYRAFQVWTGQTPEQARATQAAR